MKTPRKQLVAKADKLFSEYVRLRDSVDGYGECITCGKRLHYKAAHAGHFQKRKHYSTRWEEENVNLQCAGCNTYNDGEQYQYAKALELKYGDGTSDKLHQMARDGIGQKFPSAEIEQIIEDIKINLDFLRNEKDGA